MLRQDLIIWFDDMTRETLKSKQRKQIFCFFHDINSPSKRLLEKMNLIEANITPVFVMLSHYRLHIKATL